MHHNKRFEKSLYQQFDKKAKIAGVEFLTSLGYTNPEIPEKELKKMGDFFIVSPNSERLIIECEVKNVWVKSKEWQYPGQGIDFPLRKGESSAAIFLMFNSTLTNVLMVNREDLLSSSLRYKNTSNKFSGTQTFREPFFNVNESKAKFYYKQDLLWLQF